MDLIQVAWYWKIICTDSKNERSDKKKMMEGGDIHIPLADSCWYMAETNRIL